MLYLVATPIGNLDDITIRALKILEKVEIIACEDTRNTQKLLNHFEIKNKKLISYHEHNEDKASETLIDYLEQGIDIALVSDAGMPCISDPGYVLIKKCRERALPVYAIPGANAGLTALISSGIESYNYTFYGFLPRKNKELVDRLEFILKQKTTAIIYESPHRITNLVEQISKLAGERVISVARELTKMYEQIETNSAVQIFEMLEQGLIKEKGEFVLIIAPNDEKEPQIESTDMVAEIEQLVAAGMKNSEAIKSIAKKYKVNKREVYNLYHEKHV